uniref:Uncharacterized protein n=1 Tax=Arundo donax TaxID=35708 RepID=A0A0A9C5L8_ARUDO
MFTFHYVYHFGCVYCLCQVVNICATMEHWSHVNMDRLLNLLKSY